MSLSQAWLPAVGSELRSAQVGSPAASGRSPRTPPTAPPVRFPVRPGDRLGGFPGGKPLAILVWAAWSRPSVAEKRMLEELVATGSALAGRIRLITLDLDLLADAPRVDALGGAPALPALYLATSDGIVRRRIVGWPARNPTEIRAVLGRELSALTVR